jgi:hypothetical protein
MRATKVAYDGAQSTTVFRTCQWFAVNSVIIVCKKLQHGLDSKGDES